MNSVVPFSGYVGMALLGAGNKASPYADTRSIWLLPSDLSITFLKASDLPTGTRLRILDKAGVTIAEGELPRVSETLRPTVFLIQCFGRVQAE